MKFFKNNFLTKKQRWQRALIFGIGASLVSAIVIGIVQYILGFTSSWFDLAIAFFISWVIVEVGHGVDKKFSILSAVCTFVAIFLADAIGFMGIYTLLYPFQSLYIVIVDYLTIDLINILMMIVKIYAIYFAYERAKI